jgi:uncharacterized BrkB/YihY/UPF0761 family membrane protein
MIREELKQLSTTPRDLRKFGLLVGGVFAAIGVWFLLRHKPAGPWFVAPGALLMLLGLAVPKTLKAVYLGWMAMAITLGIVVSTVLLTFFYFLVITPIGLAARLLGKDFLSRKLDRGAKSYWLPRDRSVPRKPADYEQQF